MKQQAHTTLPDYVTEEEFFRVDPGWLMAKRTEDLLRGHLVTAQEQWSDSTHTFLRRYGISGPNFREAVYKVKLWRTIDPRGYWKKTPRQLPKYIGCCSAITRGKQA